MILVCQGINKSFGSMHLIKDASFHIEEREKAALIGINGAGKSTLLKIIMGEMPSDSGEIILAKGRTIGYLAQHQELDGDQSIYDVLLEVKQHILDMEKKMRSMELEMKHASGEQLEHLMESYSRLSHEFELENGYAYKSQLTGVLKGLGFPEEEFQKPVSTLSGGQKTRVALGKLLLSEPDIILLDEPTNHLDMESITALNNGMIKFPGVLLFTSRDHQIVQTTANRIMEIVPGGKLIDKITTYDEYLESDEMARKRQTYTVETEEED